MTHRYLNGKCVRCGSLDRLGVDRGVRAELVKASQTLTFDVTIGDDKNPCLPEVNRHDFQEGKCINCGRAFPQYSEPLDQCPGKLSPEAIQNRRGVIPGYPVDEPRCAHGGPLSACSTCSLNGMVTAHKNRLVQPQPDPILNERPAVWDLVMADMRDRDREGRRKYKTPLQPHNGRDAMTDAYQEALDLCVYLRQAIFERDGA